MSNVKQTLLEIFSPDELEEKISKEMEEGGARTEHSAMNKILKRNNTKVLLEKDREGYFLNDYERRDGQKNILIATDMGIKRISGDINVDVIDRWQPITVSNVAKVQKLTTKSTWLEATDDTTVQPMDTYNVPLDKMFQAPGDIDGGGIYLVKGRIQFVNEVPIDFDDDNQPTGYHPIVDGTDVNLKLVVTDQEGNRCRVTMDTLGQLQGLSGLDELGWVNSDPDELSDILANKEVIVLGGGNNMVNGNRVTPFLQMRTFGFVEGWD